MEEACWLCQRRRRVLVGVIRSHRQYCCHLEDWNQRKRSVGSVDSIVIIVSGYFSAVVLCVLALAVLARLFV